MLVPRMSAARSRDDRSDSALGHVSVQSTERYIVCKQQIREAVNDLIDNEL